MNKKKLIIIGGLVLLVILILTLLFLNLFAEREETYTGEPISQEAISPNDIRNIEVDDLRIDASETYKIWALSNKVSMSSIEDMISKIGLNLPLEQKEEGSFYEWTDGQGNYFQYYLLRNSLIFNLVDGIPWDEANLTSNSFSSFVKEYFDADWSYEFTEMITFPDRERFFYAKRLTKDGWGIERTPNLYRETDYLSLKDGKIMAGEILLTHFFDPEIKVPLLSTRELSRYINDSNYPKIITTRPDQVASALSIEEDYAYMNMEILELQQEIDDCKAINYTVVYLYNSFEQTYLTPVYRLALECNLEYEGQRYSIPSIGYVNAVNPQYIAIPE